MRKTKWLMVSALLGAVTEGVPAGVLESRESSFTIESVATTRAAPAAVYAALGKVSAWWDPEHTWSGSAQNLSLELQAGGCFCEKLPDGGSLQHGRVIYAQPGVMLRLDSPLGPLQEMPVTGVLTFRLEPHEGGTKITLNYRVAGAFTLESAKLAPIVDQVMHTQLDRLAAYTGSPPK
jgi:uncharacterized protein YndB with AHSA1/START domain